MIDKLNIVKDIMDMITDECVIVSQHTFNVDHMRAIQTIYRTEADQVAQECGFANALDYELYIASIDKVSKLYSCAN